MSPLEAARYIDSTLLSPVHSAEQLTQLCQEAIEYSFFGVCVHPASVAAVSSRLSSKKGPIPVSVVGFPLGQNGTDVKSFESSQAIKAGAKELDMVADLVAFKGKDFARVESDIAAVVRAAEGLCVKVIIETAYLTHQEIADICRMAVNAGAAFVKSSTGFAQKGAVAGDIEVMRKAVGVNIGVKASGGIRQLQDFESMISAGASRIGTSSGPLIIEELRARG